MKSSILVNFDKSVQTAVLSMENWNADSTINWDFVEADVWMDLGMFYDRDAIQNVVASEFDSYADEITEWMTACSVTTFEKFVALS
jgi:hypothetical protein